MLIPHKKEGVEGFLVFNPLYCYEGGRLSFKEIHQKGDLTKVERSAVILNRGWIPATLRDKRSRINETNSRKLVKVKGVFRAGKDIHSYSAPNNPDNNEWYNLSLMDMGTFWDLPNYHESSYYYFQAVDLEDNMQNYNSAGVVLPSRDEIIEDHYEWRWRETTHDLIYKGLGACSAGLCALAYMCL